MMCQYHVEINLSRRRYKSVHRRLKKKGPHFMGAFFNRQKTFSVKEEV